MLGIFLYPNEHWKILLNSVRLKPQTFLTMWHSDSLIYKGHLSIKIYYEQNQLIIDKPTCTYIRDEQIID